MSVCARLSTVATTATPIWVHSTTNPVLTLQYYGTSIVEFVNSPNRVITSVSE